MKKTIGGLLAAFLLTTGLVALTPSTAHAAQCAAYTGCFSTSTRVGEVSVSRDRATLRATVTVRGSNRRANGLVKFVVKGAGFYQARTVQLTNGRASMTTRRMPDGTYTTKARYIRRSGAPFVNSNSGVRQFRV